MSQNSYSEFYKHSPFTTEENQKLNSSFLDFGEIWNITISLIKRNFKRVILIPTLWQLLVGVGFLVIIGVFAYGTFVSLAPSYNSYNPYPASSIENTYSTKKASDDGLSMLGRNQNSLAPDRFAPYTGPTSIRSNTDLDYRNNPTPDNLSSSIGAMLGAFALLFIAYIAIAIFLALINLRQRYILNDISVSSIWKTPRGIYIDLLKLIALGIIYAVLYLIVVFTSSIFSAAGAPFLGIILEWGFSLVIFSFFGLSSHLIIYERADIGESISTSFELMKPIFWKNVLRYFLFALVCAAVYLVVILVSVILGFVLYFSVGAVFYSPEYALLTFLFIVIGIIYFAVVLIGFYSLRFVFEYVSFYNIRLLQSQNSNNKSSEVEAITLNNPAVEKSEVLTEAKTEIVSEKAEKVDAKLEVEHSTHHTAHHHKRSLEEKESDKEVIAKPEDKEETKE